MTQKPKNMLMIINITIYSDLEEERFQELPELTIQMTEILLAMINMEDNSYT